jgi:hypothetical protein
LRKKILSVHLFSPEVTIRRILKLKIVENWDEWSAWEILISTIATQLALLTSSALGNLQAHFAISCSLGRAVCHHANVRWATYTTVATFFFTLLRPLAYGQNRVPDEVRYKSGYLNSSPRPADFSSAMLWGIAIADTRIAGYEKATVEVARVRLSCRVDGRDVVLNDDRGEVRGGLYRRFPWFGADEHEALPDLESYTSSKTGKDADERQALTLRVGTRPDRVWHFWAASSRARIPSGKLGGCTVLVRAKISRGALLQVGFDYWRNPTIDYGSGGNNHEAGVSDWYFPSTRWQEATFTDLKN